MKTLSDITYNKMKELIYNEINSHKDIVLDWILLPHTEFFKLCGKKYLIKCSEELRIERLLKRDNISLEKIQERDKASIEYNEDDFDYIIEQ